MYENNSDRLQKLEKKLYSRKSPDVIDVGRTELKHSEGSFAVGDDWQKSDNGKFDQMAYKFAKAASGGHAYVKKFFFASLSFFVLAALIAIFIFWRGGNLVSSENVDIKVISPLSIAAGQEVSFDVGVINNNNARLDMVSVLVEYPIGTRKPVDLKELNSERFDLGSIEPGEQVAQKVSAVFYGDKESIKNVKISLEYRIENSSALFYKEKKHEFSISSAPIIITPTYPKEVNSNQDVDFKIEVVSNSKEPINGLLLKVDYPFGFVYKSSNTRPLDRDNIWVIPTLKQGEKKTISITGTIIGQDNEEKSFRIYSGTKSEDDERDIKVMLAELTETIAIKKPFLGITTSIENSSGDYAATNGQDVNVRFIIRNNLPNRVFNIKADAKVSGGALDKNGVNVGSGGYYRSIDNTISWDDRSVAQLRDMGPGETVTLNFSLKPLDYQKISKSERPELNIDFKVVGERVLESGSVENINAFETRKITLTTNLNLAARAVRSIGKFENSGPIPPKAEQNTTYTIVWGITNTFNQASDTEVRATLPPYVRFTGLKNPDDGSFTYNPLSNELVWNAGTVLPNAGFGASPKEAYFQVELLPSTSQIGSSPVLVGEATLQSRDRVTGVTLVDTAPAVTTNFNTDSTFRMGDDKVIP